MQYSAKNAARDRAAEKIEIFDQEYTQVIRTRKVRRELRELIDQHDALADQIGAEGAAAAEVNELLEKQIDVQCAAIALLLQRGKAADPEHPDPAQMAEEMDGRDITAIFYGLLGAVQETTKVPPTKATTPA